MIKEYQCPTCGSKKEVIILPKATKKKISSLLPECDSCGQKMEEVEFPLSSFRLKGKDWYKPNLD